VGALMFSSCVKRWLLAERIEQLQSSDEAGGTEHQQPQGEPVSEGAMTQEPVVASRGVVRRAEIPLLANYGTSYALFNEWIADYECVLISDTYRLGDYAGDHVWVSGSLTDVIEGIPVMQVTHLELLQMKWMR
jgi:hypothetical protein